MVRDSPHPLTDRCAAGATCGPERYRFLPSFHPSFAPIEDAAFRAVIVPNGPLFGARLVRRGAAFHTTFIPRSLGHEGGFSPRLHPVFAAPRGASSPRSNAC